MKINSGLTINSYRDFELVMAIRSGDENAFNQLIEIYKEAIFFMLLKMVNNKKNAETLSVDVFNQVLVDLHEYEPRFPFCIWLFRIASNIAIAHLRQKNTVASSGKQI